MTKRFQHWLGQMSLTQQLVSVIALSLLMFGFFFFVYLRSNIQGAVVAENYAVLDRSQQQVIASYKQSWIDLDDTDWPLEDISHEIFVNGNPQTYLGSYLEEQDPSKMYALATEKTDKDHTGTLMINNEIVYYQLTTIYGNTKILSLMSNASGNLLAQNLFNKVSNVSAFVVAIVFLFMIYWVTTLIHPLNQIKNYIDKVRKNQTATLEINRSDEIGEVAQAVKDMQAELTHQDEVKEEMIHNISHDLKTPIATIKSYAESIKDGIYPYDTLDKSVDVIIDNADRLDHKVHSLLVLNRLDYLLSSSERQMNSINMNKIVEVVRLSLSAIRPSIEIKIGEQPTVFRGDEESWRILVENLMENALRYAQTQVRIELRPGYLCCSNDGPTISEEQMKKLFRPFEKGDKGKFGLGLSICSKITEAYGYQLEAKNQDDGVSFIVSDTSYHPEEGQRKRKEKEREQLKKQLKQQAKNNGRKEK